MSTIPVSSQTAEADPQKEKICFVIMPIGSEGTELRKRFNEVYKYLIIPGVNDASRAYKCIRADEVQKPNNIVKDIAHKL